MSRESKFLARLLRHEPSLIDIRLDHQGWVKIDELLRKLRKFGHGLSIEQLLIVIDTDDKRRFTLSHDGRNVRAAQGHSVDVDLGLSPVIPPEVLYHGTATRSLKQIFKNGLTPGRRQQVHLSLDPETATDVGRRHGKPIVLVVKAGKMHGAGHIFTCSDNGVWLTDRVPAAFLGFGTVR